MDDSEYFNKMDKKDYKSKDYKVAIHPAGHQMSLSSGQTDQVLKLNGFKSVSDARKAGWTFDGR